MLSRTARYLVLGLVIATCGSHPVAAQEAEPTFRLGSAVKSTLLDPTTYAPALFGLDATMRDWKASQPFFANGYVERNERFTISGRPFDQAISYEDGRTQILKDALSVFEVSLIQNFSSRLVEQSLLKRFPEHRRMVKTFGWIERISVASLMSYHLAGPHYRQWRQNEALAVQFGYR